METTQKTDTEILQDLYPRVFLGGLTHEEVLVILRILRRKELGLT